MESITVTINNWDKFNPRKDVAHSSWFRFGHGFFEDPQFFDFSHLETISWLYILCQASKSSKGKILVNQKHLETIGRIKTRDFKNALEKLKRNGTVTVTVTPTIRERDEGDTGTCSTRRDVTNETRRDDLDQAGARSPVRFNFDSVYEKYPRKEGKSIGLRKLKADIQSQQDYEALCLALTRYVEHCKSNAIEHRFIKHFSSWVSHWRDWIDPKTGTGLDFSSGESGLSLTERLKLKEEKRKLESEAST